MCDQSCVGEDSCRYRMDSAKQEMGEATGIVRQDLEGQLLDLRLATDQALEALRSELESQVTDAKTRVRRTEDRITTVEQKHRMHYHDRLSGRPSGW